MNYKCLVMEVSSNLIPALSAALQLVISSKLLQNACLLITKMKKKNLKSQSRAVCQTGVTIHPHVGTSVTTNLFLKTAA